MLLPIALCALAAVTTRGSAAASPPACRPNQTTTVIIDGELYGMVRAAGPRYVFGWSGKPVLTFDEALRLLRNLGLRGTDRQLFGLVSGAHKIPGATYGVGGSIAYFFLRCRGRYTATVVVRGGRYLPATRIWLHEERRRVLPAFCMDEEAGVFRLRPCAAEVAYSGLGAGGEGRRVAVSSPPASRTVRSTGGANQDGSGGALWP